MSNEFSLAAEARSDKGKGASRRLRRDGLVPAVLYGGGQDPQSLSLSHNEVMKSLSHEAFYSHILELEVGGSTVQAILRDVQRHPFKRAVLHLDFQRVKADEEITMNVPLHFIGEDVCPGVKQGGGTVSHVVTEVEITCLPKDLPEYLEVDVSNVELNDSVHLSDIKVPPGVTIVELTYGEEHDSAVATVSVLRTADVEEEEEAAEGLEAEEGEEGVEGAPEADDEDDKDDD